MMSSKFNIVMKAEDLSEEQHDAAMNDLGIEGQEPTDQEIAALEVEEEKHPSSDCDKEIKPKISRLFPLLIIL